MPHRGSRPSRTSSAKLDLRRQHPRVPLQAGVCDVQYLVSGWKRPGGRVGGDSRGCILTPGPRRAGRGANELRPVLIAPEVAGAPRSGGWRAVRVFGLPFWQVGTRRNSYSEVEPQFYWERATKLAASVTLKRCPVRTAFPCAVNLVSVVDDPNG